jgi:hypothetical protein
MSHLSNPKRNHHFLPKLYLKGFAEGKKKPFVWVYEKDGDYNPGHKSHNNPQRRPINYAGAQKDGSATE